MKNIVFKAISDPTRRSILDQLALGDLLATEIPLKRKISQPALSQHLKVLVEAKLVIQKKEGRKVICKLNPKQLKRISDWIKHYEHFWENKLDNLGQVLEAME